MEQLTTKTIIAIIIGNALEWYDFIVYSFMTVYIAKLFFPTNHSITSLLAATASFGVAFLMRPIGGVILGIYADRISRKAALMVGILLMTLAILLISFTPTYSKIGIFAPLLIVLARLIQGFSAGGEFSTATSMLIELAPQHKKRFYSSWQMVGQALAKLIATIFCFVIVNSFSAQQMEEWGWRIPFILGLIILPIGIYIRQHLEEPILATKTTLQIQHYWRELLIAAGLVAGCTVNTYVGLSYMPTYAHVFLNIPLNLTLFAIIIPAIILIITIPLAGYLADRMSAKKILLIDTLIFLAVIYPLYAWLNTHPNVMHLIIVQSIICFILGPYFGVHSAMLAEQFPREIRSTCLSISYNLAVLLFGGFAQFIVTLLIQKTGTPIAITYYLFSGMILTLIATLFYREKGITQHEHAGMAFETHRV